MREFYIAKVKISESQGEAITREKMVKAVMMTLCINGWLKGDIILLLLMQEILPGEKQQGGFSSKTTTT